VDDFDTRSNNSENSVTVPAEEKQAMMIIINEIDTTTKDISKIKATYRAKEKELAFKTNSLHT